MHRYITDAGVDFRSLYLLVDAYHSKRVLPLYVVQLLDGLTFPFFITALISVDRVLASTMKFGRPQQRPRDRSAIEGVGMVAYFILSVVLYIRASLVPHFRSWIVAAQAVFVTWSLVLFFMLVGSVKRIYQGRPRSLILVPIINANATSDQSV